MLLTELRRTVLALQNRLAVMDTRSETNRIATKVELLSKRLDEHDRWFNPHDIDEIILRLSGSKAESMFLYSDLLCVLFFYSQPFMYGAF